MRDPCSLPPAFQIMIVFLSLPPGIPAPFLDEPLAIAFNEWAGFVVLGFEEVGDAEDGEGDGFWCVGVGVGEDFVDGFLEVFFANVPVGS